MAMLELKPSTSQWKNWHFDMSIFIDDHRYGYWCLPGWWWLWAEWYLVRAGVTEPVLTKYRGFPDALADKMYQEINNMKNFLNRTDATYLLSFSFGKLEKDTIFSFINKSVFGKAIPPETLLPTSETTEVQIAYVPQLFQKSGSSLGLTKSIEDSIVSKIRPDNRVLRRGSPIKIVYRTGRVVDGLIYDFGDGTSLVEGLKYGTASWLCDTPSAREFSVDDGIRIVHNQKGLEELRSLF